MDTYTILVVNNSIAYLYKMEFIKSGKLELIKTLDHPAGRQKNIELTTDKPGRAQKDDRAQRVAFASASEPKTVEKVKFIKQIAQELEQFIKHDPQIQFILVSEPEFMGKLNKLLPEQIRKHVIHRINKNLTFIDSKELINILTAEIKPGLFEQG